MVAGMLRKVGLIELQSTLIINSRQLTGGVRSAAIRKLNFSFMGRMGEFNNLTVMEGIRTLLKISVNNDDEDAFPRILSKCSLFA
jgi:hypothetical protein